MTSPMGVQQGLEDCLLYQGPPPQRARKRHTEAGTEPMVNVMASSYLWGQRHEPEGKPEGFNVCSSLEGPYLAMGLRAQRAGTRGQGTCILSRGCSHVSGAPWSLEVGDEERDSARQASQEQSRTDANCPPISPSEICLGPGCVATLDTCFFKPT